MITPNCKISGGVSRCDVPWEGAKLYEESTCAFGGLDVFTVRSHHSISHPPFSLVATPPSSVPRHSPTFVNSENTTSVCPWSGMVGSFPKAFFFLISQCTPNRRDILKTAISINDRIFAVASRFSVLWDPPNEAEFVCYLPFSLDDCSCFLLLKAQGTRITIAITPRTWWCGSN